jgi:hypothetical protein
MRKSLVTDDTPVNEAQALQMLSAFGLTDLPQNGKCVELVSGSNDGVYLTRRSDGLYRVQWYFVCG